MKTQDTNDWYQPEKPLYHAKLIGIIILCMAPIIYQLKQPILSEFTLRYIILAILIIEGWLYLSFRVIRYHKGMGQDGDLRISLVRLVILYGSCIFLALLIIFLFQAVMFTIHGQNFTPHAGAMIQNSLKSMKGLLFPMLALLTIILYGQWQMAIKRLTKLNEENLIFQNETLKNQVNPHFLFNSLNTLLSLVSTNSENVERFIIKLSSIYRYIAENSARDRVPLALELAFINDFFYLNKIRDEEKIQLEIDVTDADKYEIMPVSLQLLIENALKHNMATREAPLKITVSVEDGYIVVKNNLQKMASKPASSKIGLRNLSERVRLTSQRRMIVEETPDEYIVKIPLTQ